MRLWQRQRYWKLLSSLSVRTAQWNRTGIWHRYGETSPTANLNHCMKD
nr:MAG TPA: hypothetical protein [Bacteriophage sp.]